jgi:D-amino-acid dehydrogenase
MNKRVVVIGGGVIGLCVAYYAMRRGHSVLLIERLPSKRDGCSFGNAGMVVPSHFVPLAAPGIVRLALKWMWNPESPLFIEPRLNWDLLSWGWKFYRAATARHVRRAAPLLRDLGLASRLCFEELAALPSVDFALVKKGLLMLCKTQHALDEEARVARLAEELGIPAQVLDARDTAALDPGVRMDIAGAVYFPKDCHLAPDKFVSALEQEITRGGGTLQWGTDVVGWRVKENCIAMVQTTRGDFSGDEFVLCGGACSPGVVRKLGLRLPMQAGKGYSLTLARPRELPNICAIFAEARLAVTPMGAALRFAGTMEIAKPNAHISALRIRGIVNSVPRYYPGFSAEDFSGIQPWSGLRPCSPDGLPYVGRFRAYKNLSTATGHGMLGVSLGPITGSLMASVLSNEPPEIDLTLLSPDRYR